MGPRAEHDGQPKQPQQPLPDLPPIPGREIGNVYTTVRAWLNDDNDAYANRNERGRYTEAEQRAMEARVAGLMDAHLIQDNLELGIFGVSINNGPRVTSIVPDLTYRLSLREGDEEYSLDPLQSIAEEEGVSRDAIEAVHVYARDHRVAFGHYMGVIAAESKTDPRVPVLDQPVVPTIAQMDEAAQAIVDAAGHSPEFKNSLINRMYGEAGSAEEQQLTDTTYLDRLDKFYTSQAYFEMVASGMEPAQAKELAERIITRGRVRWDQFTQPEKEISSAEDTNPNRERISGREFTGVLDVYSGQDTEGAESLVLHDERFIFPAVPGRYPEQWSLGGLHILQDGDHLTIYSKEDPEQAVWEGEFSLQPQTEVLPDGGTVIYADQQPIDPMAWEGFFYDQYQAKLTTKQEQDAQEIDLLAQLPQPPVDPAEEQRRIDKLEQDPNYIKLWEQVNDIDLTGDERSKAFKEQSRLRQRIVYGLLPQESTDTT